MFKSIRILKLRKKIRIVYKFKKFDTTPEITD